MPAYLVDVPKDEMLDIVNINVTATLRVTYAVLPRMVQKCVRLSPFPSTTNLIPNFFRKRGLILNIGSFAGAVPSPMLAPYSGTKAFLPTFSDALGAEVKKDGITVEHVNTYFVVRTLLLLLPSDNSRLPYPNPPHLTHLNPSPGLQTLQNPQAEPLHPHARPLRPLRAGQDRPRVRRRVQRAPEHVDAVLVARADGLRDDAGGREEHLHRAHASVACGYPAEGAEEGGEGGEAAVRVGWPAETVQTVWVG